MTISWFLPKPKQENKKKGSKKRRRQEDQDDDSYDFFKYAPGGSRQYFGIRKIMRTFLGE